MRSQQLYFRDDLFGRLKKEPNMSALINNLLDNHYILSDEENNIWTANDEAFMDKADKLKKKLLKVRKLEKQAKDRADKDEEDLNKAQQINNFVKDMQDKEEEEYREGLLANKWRSYWEYAKTKIDL